MAPKDQFQADKCILQHRLASLVGLLFLAITVERQGQRYRFVAFGQLDEHREIQLTPSVSGCRDAFPEKFP